MFTIVETSWDKHQAVLARLRREVFIQEQQVPQALEWDGLDQGAVHLLAWDLGAQAMGCARLLTDHRLGRMAVLQRYRGLGVGNALLQAALQYAHTEHWPQISISAQTHALAFYVKAGFVVTSDEYLDAGIPHRDMCLYLSG